MKNHVIQDKELEEIFQYITQKSNQTGLNPYDTYIQEIRKKRENLSDSESYMEKHHIIPKFEKGSDSEENLIRLTVKEHIIAHWIRWQVFNKDQDRMAYLFRIGDTAEALKLKSLAIQKARKRDQEEGKGRFSSDYQSLMGKRDGSKGGQANTPSQFEARQMIGLTYGRKTGISNQQAQLKEFLSAFSIWEYRGKKNQLLPEKIYVLINPKEAFIDVVKSLNQIIPNSIPVESASSMYKLVYEERPQIYGWRIVNKLIRSEFEVSIQNFHENFPNSFLILEEEFLRTSDFE